MGLDMAHAATVQFIHGLIAAKWALTSRKCVPDFREESMIAAS